MGLNRIRDMSLDYLEKGYSTRKPRARLELLKSGYDFRGDPLRLDAPGRIRLWVDNFTPVSVDDRAAARGGIERNSPCRHNYAVVTPNPAWPPLAPSVAR